jgi:hypothetical protein
VKVAGLKGIYMRSINQVCVDGMDVWGDGYQDMGGLGQEQTRYVLSACLPPFSMIVDANTSPGQSRTRLIKARNSRDYWYT